MESAYQKILDEYQALAEQISKSGGFSSASAKGGSAFGGDIVRLGKRQAALTVAVKKIKKLTDLEREYAENKKLVKDKDPEISRMALSEEQNLESKILNLRSEIEEELLPKDPLDENDAIMEIRAAAGGNESSLFAAELFRMYGKFAEKQGWKTHIVSSSRSEAGGFKEVIFEIVGTAHRAVQSGQVNDLSLQRPYAKFKFESGVHRVQRVPETEKSGRVHTSTVTVAVLPELKEADYKLDPKDLKIEATTSSGHGGQSVNTTYSAIRILHVPTGITAQCQDERSQVQNKEKALAVIRARVAAHYREIENKKIRDLTRSQIGTGDRSEKIRTYNFPQDRITDHRINQSFKQIQEILEGKLEPIISVLRAADAEMKKEALKN